MRSPSGKQHTSHVPYSNNSPTLHCSYILASIPTHSTVRCASWRLGSTQRYHFASSFYTPPRPLALYGSRHASALPHKSSTHNCSAKIQLGTRETLRVRRGRLNIYQYTCWRIRLLRPGGVRDGYGCVAEEIFTHPVVAPTRAVFTFWRQKISGVLWATVGAKRGVAGTILECEVPSVAWSR